MKSNPFLEESLYRDTTDKALKYLASLPSRKVLPDAEAIEQLANLEESLPENGIAADQVISQLDDCVGAATVAMNGPRFFGFVIGGGYPVSVAANWLASAWDQATGIYRVTTATAKLEAVALRWLTELFGVPSGCAGGFVTGATVANFTALAAARNALYRSVDWDVEAKGLIGAPNIHVIVGDEYHPSVMKSLGMVGLGRNRVSKIPVDQQGRAIADQLPEISAPTIVCLQAGNVNTGAFDPFEQIIEHLRANSNGHQVWIHVDGAFGLWATASKEKRALTRGIEKADSWATDAHKWLNVPYDSGIVLVRDSRAIESAMAVTAEYLPMETPERNPSDFTPELSRRARGIEIWSTLKFLGKNGVEDLVDRCCRHARMFATELENAGYEILNEVVLNQVLVSFGDPAKTNRVIEAIQQDGTCWCGGTVWQGKTAMRISTSNWATSDDDIRTSLDTIIRIAKSA